MRNIALVFMYLQTIFTYTVHRIELCRILNILVYILFMINTTDVTIMHADGYIYIYTATYGMYGWVIIVTLLVEWWLQVRLSSKGVLGRVKVFLRLLIFRINYFISNVCTES